MTTLRRALLTGRCQLRYNCHVTRLANDGGHVTGVEYVDGDGAQHGRRADAFVLAAAPIESARLCLLSPTPGGGALGNSSGQVGRNLMFHFQTNVNGFFPRRVHGQRGMAVTSGISDFRGVEPGGAEIRVVDTRARPARLPRRRVRVRRVAGAAHHRGRRRVRRSSSRCSRFGQPAQERAPRPPLGQHLFGLLMQGEDAPQRVERRRPSTRRCATSSGCRCRASPTRTTRSSWRRARFYVPIMKQVRRQRRAPTRVFATPCDFAVRRPADVAPRDGHAAHGRRSRDVGHATPTGASTTSTTSTAATAACSPPAAGWNPTLTIIAVALRTAHGIAGGAARRLDAFRGRA